MCIARMAFLLAAALLFGSSAWSADAEGEGKVYRCGDEKMMLRELPDGRLELKGKMLTGIVSVHAQTGLFRGEVLGWGSQHKTPQDALANTCNRILKRSKLPLPDELEKELHEFYDALK